MAEDLLESHLLDQVANQLRMKEFFWHRLRSRFAIGAIRKWAGERPVVLDIGAGAGVLGTHLSEWLPNSEYKFVEPIESLSRELERRYQKSSNWSGLDYQAADALVLLDVLEHQENDVEFLRDLHSKMRAGAILVVTVPAMMLLWSEWDRKMGHYRRYDLRSLRSAAVQAGFEVLSIRYLFQAMVLPGLARRFRNPGKMDSEFPAVSTVINRCLYVLGRLEQIVGSWIPLGSSLGLVCRRAGVSGK
ncbi:MAG: methyltransferase domain-containing protein [Bdellovibrionota bacterium]